MCTREDPPPRPGRGPRLLRHPGAGHRLGRSRRDPRPARLHPPRPPPGDVVERRHRRHRARRAVAQPRPLPGLAAGAAAGDAPRGRRPPRRARRRSSTTSRRAGRPGCSRPTTRCPACSTTLREPRPRPRRSAPTGTGTSSPRSPRPGWPGASTRLVSSAWAGARKPHPRIYRYLLEQAGLDPARRAVRRRHVGPRRGGPARGGHDAGLPRARRALAGRDETGRRRPRSPVARIRDLTGILPLLGRD